MLRREHLEFQFKDEPKLVITYLEWGDAPAENADFVKLAWEQTPAGVLAYESVLRAPTAKGSLFYVYVRADDGRLLRVDEWK